MVNEKNIEIKYHRKLNPLTQFHQIYYKILFKIWKIGVPKDKIWKLDIMENIWK